MTELVRYEAAIVALRKAHDVDEVQTIRDQSEAARAYARQAQDPQLETFAAEIKLRAERRAGEILKEMATAGTRDSGVLNLSRGHSPVTPGARLPRLSDLNVTKNQSYEWQQLADVPEETFEAYLGEKRAKGEPVSSSEARRHLARQTRKATMRKQVTADAGVIDGTFRVIYADPPWSYGSSGVIDGGDSYGRAERHYETLTIDQLCALRDANGRRISDVARDDAVLFLWVTSPLLAECWPVIESWGFHYKALMVWHKLAHNYGNYVSVRQELLLICTKGSCLPDRPTPMIPSVQAIKRANTHSAKPPEFREFIERMYDGPYLELFGRAKHPGWTVWGDQVSLRAESSRRMRVCSRAPA